MQLLKQKLSLLEVMVVLNVIAILCTLTIPRLFQTVNPYTTIVVESTALEYRDGRREYIIYTPVEALRISNSFRQSEKERLFEKFEKRKCYQVQIRDTGSGIRDIVEIKP